MSAVRQAAAPARAADPGTATFCYSIQAAADPGVMPRVVALFAKRGLVPSKWVSVVTPGGGLEIDVQVADLADDTGRYVAECLRQVVAVRAVLVATRPV